jgi:hypothetical protein
MYQHQRQHQHSAPALSIQQSSFSIGNQHQHHVVTSPKLLAAERAIARMSGFNRYEKSIF